MTACHEFLELMSTSLDQTLSPEEQALLDNHLAKCPECRVARKELQWTYSQIKTLEAVEPPPWLASKIMARIRAEAAPQASFWRRFIRPIVMKPQLQVASILLLAATGFYLLRSQRDAFGGMKQQQAPAPIQSPSQKSNEARDKLAPESKSKLREVQKPPSEGMNQNRLEDSKPSESGFAPPPIPLASSKPETAKQERDGALSGHPAAALPTPSALAGASLGAGVAVVAESAAPPMRRAKKSSQSTERLAQADRTNRAEETRQKGADSTGQLMDQPERKDKSDAETWVIRLEMADPRAAKQMIERELARTGATVMPPREPTASRVLSARLASHRLPDLLSRLARIGKVLEQPDIPGDKSSLITISISW